MEKNKKIKTGYVFTMILIGLSVLILVATSFSPVTENNSFVSKPVSERVWELAPLADADPGAGNSGFLEGRHNPYAATPLTTYNANISNATAYEFSDSINSTMTGETPYDTVFDVAHRHRFNVTDLYNSTGSTWELDWVYLNITCADLGIATAITMEEIEIVNNSEFAWVTFYIQDADGGAGTGFTITHDEKVNATYQLYIFR